MSLIKRPEKAILDRVNAEDQLSLTVRDVTYQSPVEIPPISGTNSDTRIRMLATQIAPYRGAVSVTYRKPLITECFTNKGGVNGITIKVPATTTKLHDCLSYLKLFYGFPIEPYEVENTDIDWDQNQVVIRFTPEAKGWSGEVIANVVLGPFILSEILTVKTLQLFNYPQFNTRKGQGPIYSYRFNFSDYANQLKDMTAENMDLAVIANVMKYVTGDNWNTYRNPDLFNIKESHFVYNGLNNNPDILANRNYTRVLVIDLGLFNINFGGYLYLHYDV